MEWNTSKCSKYHFNSGISLHIQLTLAMNC